MDHPWLACGEYTKTEHDVKNYTVFKVNYPIEGVINIPVEVDMGIEYGYDFIVKNTIKQNHLCNINFKPKMKPFISGKGGVKIIKLAEGGVYGNGIVADTDVDFGF